MKRHLRIFSICLCAALASSLTATPAPAITAELAKKCRQLALEAYPPVRTGSKAGTAAETRGFYQSCIANGGTPPNVEPKSGSGASQQQTGKSASPPAKPQ